jgi:urea transport system substrate-binding protein
VGHLSCWCYFQNVDTPQNRQFKSDWKNYVTAHNLKHRPDMVIDPMVSTYLGINLWAQAAAKAKSTGTDAVRQALAGQSMVDPAGYTVRMDASSQYLWRGDMIGSINGNQGFDVLWKSKDIVKPVPFSPFIGKA